MLLTYRYYYKLLVAYKNKEQLIVNGSISLNKHLYEQLSLGSINLIYSSLFTLHAQLYFLKYSDYNEHLVDKGPVKAPFD